MGQEYLLINAKEKQPQLCSIKNDFLNQSFTLVTASHTQLQFTTIGSTVTL